VAAAPPASAYVRTRTDKQAPVAWLSPCVVLRTHPGDLPPGVTIAPGLIGAAARAAAAAWSRPGVACTAFELRVTEETPGPPLQPWNDGINNLIFPRVWTYEPATLAITTVFARQDSGTILDADVEVNTSRAMWGDRVAGAAALKVVDLQNTLTHEFGHLLGLDHNCSFPGNLPAIDDKGAPVPDCAHALPPLPEATMYPAGPTDDVERRTLAADDVAGVCGVYPVALARSCDAPDAGADARTAPGEDGGADATAATPDTASPDATPDTAPAPDTASPDAAVVTLPSTRGCDCATGGRTRIGVTPFSVVLCLSLAFLRRRRV
jgi:hypothetical protein